MKRDFFSSFSLVVCCGLPERSLLNLAKILWTENIPLVTVKTAGFLGYMRLQVVINYKQPGS